MNGRAQPWRGRAAPFPWIGRFLLVGAAAFTLAAFGAEHAGAQTLPESSRGENQVNSINRTLDSQSQSRAAAQQNQFEVNQLRNPVTTQPVQPVAPTIVAPRANR